MSGWLLLPLWIIGGVALGALIIICAEALQL